MLQCVAEIYSKRRQVRLLCLLGTYCEVSPSAATGGDLRVRGRILGQEKLTMYEHFGDCLIDISGSEI